MNRLDLIAGDRVEVYRRGVNRRIMTATLVCPSNAGKFTVRPGSPGLALTYSTKTHRYRPMRRAHALL